MLSIIARTSGSGRAAGSEFMARKRRETDPRRRRRDATPPIGWISPVWHATELGRVLSYGYAEPGWLSAVHVLYLLVLAGGGLLLARRVYARRLEG